MLQLCAITLGSALAGCPSSGKNDEVKTAPAPVTGPLDEYGLPPGDGPMATVNGVELPRAPLVKEMKTTVERFKKAKHEVRPALRERLKDNVVHRLIDAEIIRQQAKKLGVEITDAELVKSWQEHRARYGDEAAFRLFLEKAGTTEEDVKDQFKQNLLREKVFASVSGAVKVTDEQLRDFYEKNRERYDEPEQIRASHILLRVAPDATPDQKKKILEEAKSLLKKAKKGDFAELAAKHSQDVTRSQGGDLGWFPKGRMVKPFEDAAFALKDGEISDVVETTFGYHVIKRTGYKAGSVKSFEELKPRIERQVIARDRNEAIRNALKKWQDEAKIEIFIQGDPAIIAADKTVNPTNPAFPMGAGEKKLEVQRLPLPTTVDQPVTAPAQ